MPVCVHLLQSEMTGLVSTARVASLQAGRLEVLDAEVMQLQRLLVEVGSSIKSGAQQQQVSTAPLVSPGSRYLEYIVYSKVCLQQGGRIWLANEASPACFAVSEASKQANCRTSHSVK